MEFFNGKEARQYFGLQHDKLKQEIESFNDTEILSCNFEEWAEYFVNKYYINPITLFETNIERAITETKVKRYNPFRSYPFEKEYFEVDGVRIRFSIPFDGNPELFEIRPTTYIVTKFTTDNFIKPFGQNCGCFTLDFKYPKDELESQGEKMGEFVQKQFDNKFGSYKSMIKYVNKDTNSYNEGLFSTVMGLLEARKKKAESFAAISKALQIPLVINENAPNTKPVQLQRIVRKPAKKPQIAPMPSEPYISDEDYKNINNIIMMSGTTMEKTARTYYSNNEEELRDNLLATLNTHYESATGETFRKLGKTDIHIEFENKAAFIGECKIWHGEKMFQSAIQQVINYSTWRDLKVSVIIFNKKNQSFPDILSKIQNWVDVNSISYIHPQANVWNCKYHRTDMNVDIQLTILAFDLYVDANQFNDKRYKN